MKQILIPIDFTHACANALKYAHQLAQDKGMSLKLLHCYPKDDFNRNYEFANSDYASGIRKMLIDFYKKHVNENIADTRFVTWQGSYIAKIVEMSSDCSLVILKGNDYASKYDKWIGSRTVYIVFRSLCPVVIVPPYTNYSSWTNIWHLNRKENEAQIVSECLQKLEVDSTLVKEKKLKQTTFTSAFWKSVLSFMKAPKKELLDEIEKTKDIENIDLIILVSHNEGSFQRFVNEDTFQIIFKFNIPVLIRSALNKSVKV